jgi:hypothetical protein
MTLTDSERYTTVASPSPRSIYHAGVVQVVPHYNIGRPTNAVNVIYFSTAAIGLTAAQLNVVRTAFDTAWSTGWKTISHTAVSYVGSVVTDMSSNTGLQVSNTGYTPVPGSAGGNVVTDSVAYLISLKTAIRYKGGHGRIYIPGAATGELNNDGRTLQSGTVPFLQALWDNTVTAMTAIAGSAGGPYTPIVWHKKLAAGPNTTELVLGAVASNVLASQRRRLRKVPHH